MAIYSYTFVNYLPICIYTTINIKKVKNDT